MASNETEDRALIQATDHIGPYQVVEVAENFWGTGETAVFLILEDQVHECEREWVLKTSDPEKLARAFHESYERLAPDYGYKTREASAVPWAKVPENNKRLMIATAREVLEG